MHQKEHGVAEIPACGLGHSMSNIYVCLFASPGFKRQQDLQRRAFLEVGVPDHQIHVGGPEDLGMIFSRIFPMRLSPIDSVISVSNRMFF